MLTPPNEGEVECLRDEVKAEIARNGEEEFAKVDLDRLNSDDAYLGRFWLHAQLMEGDTKENTVKLVVETLRWRKEFGVENIRKETISKESSRHF